MTTVMQMRCRYNYTKIFSNCSNLKTLEWPEDNNLIVIQILFAVLGSLSFILNSFVLIESKNASGGQSPSLVFVRTLIVADALIGLFGIVKTIYIEYRKIRSIDCFLSESLLITASTASALSLLWLTADSSLRLSRPLDLQFHMHKKNVIALMVIVWNGSFIIGFSSQMGWVLFDYTCLFFCYYSSTFLLFVGILWNNCVFITVCLLIYYQCLNRRIQNNDHILTLSSKEYKRYAGLLSISKYHIIVWLLTYLPLIFYIAISYFCDEDSTKPNYTILYFLLLPLFKSITCAVLHAYQCQEINSVVTSHWHNITICCWRYCCQNMSSTYNIGFPANAMATAPIHIQHSCQTSNSQPTLYDSDRSLLASNYNLVSKQSSMTVHCNDNLLFEQSSVEIVTRL
ncbi:adenosine receptor A2b-like [Octopus sinensis]|uniref:Adenosine receptor A2b-like n=1 Tax=Octopus sinensis TaxID=2607531 RepID=A0A7E6FDH9_9MOLL|nr:adenosine receptor A2b-like [Octopus sinensis]